MEKREFIINIENFDNKSLIYDLSNTLIKHKTIILDHTLSEKQIMKFFCSISQLPRDCRFEKITHDKKFDSFKILIFDLL